MGDKIGKLKEKFNSYKQENNKLGVVFYDTEIKANKFAANIMYFLSALAILCLILTVTNVFKVALAGYIVFPIVFALNIIGATICYKKKGEGRWIRIMLLGILLFTVFAVSTISVYGAWVCLAIPVALSGHYYNTKLTLNIGIITMVILLVSIIIGVVLGVKYYWVDGNLVNFPDGATLVISGSLSETIVKSSEFSFGKYLANNILLYYIPQFMALLLICAICVQVSRHGRNMVLEESEILAAKTKAEKDANETKTQIMISQIQPHFVYNTLNAIYYLCDKEPARAKEAIADFSDYLRTNLNFMDKKAYISFDQELDHVKKYLSLEKMRFEDELNIEYDIKCTTFRVPALSIQPLVENAVKHGICKRQDGGTVKIYSKDALDHYEVGIIDDGVGFDMTQPLDDKRRHIGLSNTKARLSAMCNATVDIQSEIGVGTTVIIKLPKENYYENTSSR